MSYTPSDIPQMVTIAQSAHHEMAAAWLVVGAIAFLIGELKAHANVRGATGFSFLGIIIMILAAANGL